MVGSVGKKYAEANRAYLAGLFDADGAIMACIEHHPEKKFRFRVRMFVKISQKNRKILDELCLELGWGSVRLNRRVHEYDIRNQNHIAEFIQLIQPYSRVKDKQLKLAIEILEKKIISKIDLLQVAQLADTLSGYNVRSPGRRKNYTSKIQEYFSSND
jgi:hypothetical protein